MRYVIFWWTGLIWNEISTYFSSQWHSVITPSHTTVDIVDYHTLLYYLDEVKPDVVINAAGKVWSPNIDRCETNKGETLLTNTNWAVNVAIACDLLWIYNVYIGSWCIYQWDNEGKWFGETDEPNYAWSFYSRSKIKTQELLETFNTLQIRIRMPILSRSHPRNFIDKIAKYTHVISEDNSMTVVDDMVQALDVLIQKQVTGIINMTNPWVINHKEILDLYTTYVNPHHTYTAISTEELTQKFTCAWRSNCFLNTDKLLQYYPMPPIQTRIKDIVKIYATSL